MPKRPLITEKNVRDAASQGQRTLPLAPGTLVTALARDAARELKISFVEPVEAGPSSPLSVAPVAGKAPPKSLAIGADHAGFGYKKELAAHAAALGWTVTDVGTYSEERCDYPDFAYAAARLAARGEVRFGVVIDGAGVGSAMVANKLPGIRAACCGDVFSAFNARAHNDANVLTLGSRTMGIEVCKRVLEEFLKTGFEGGRHAERVQKILDVETRFLPGAGGTP
jgi:ribose 5-phosphate isomerase B